uniref:Uncharacterized protein n=1 Tax=Arundo donax TaxID=35708 RepID=A0A0A9FJH7_ARUDO
MHVVLIDFIQ